MTTRRNVFLTACKNTGHADIGIVVKSGSEIGPGRKVIALLHRIDKHVDQRIDEENPEIKWQAANTAMPLRVSFFMVSSFACRPL